MAGYTRQSIADIINGSDVTAPPLNAEFNQLAAAFDGAAGHLHDGSSGNAPKINLTTSVAGYLPAVHGGTGGKNNVTATVNPTTTDDASDGYAPGSIWENTTTGRVFICVGNTTNAAVWRELVQVQTGNKIIPEATNTVDLGDPATRFQDLWLSGSISAFQNLSVGGTGLITGNATLNADLSVAGNTTLTGTLGVTGNTTLQNLTVNGTTAINGNITLGDATTDTISYTGRVATSILPSVDDQVDLGSSVNEWRNLWIDGTANVDDLIADQADINSGSIDNTTIGANTAVSAAFNGLTVSGAVNMSGAIVSDLGTVATVDLNGGTIDGASFGASTPITEATIDNIKIDGSSITSTNVNGSINLTPNGTGSVVVSKIDANSGTIDGTAIGGAVPSTGAFTTLSTTGQATLNSAVITGGSINATPIGGSTPSTGAFTTVTASGGFTGDIAGNLTGNTAGTHTGPVVGAITGSVTGNVTASSGTSTFNNVTINGQLNMDAATAATIVNLTDPTNSQDAATKNYVDTSISNLIDGAPSTLDTLNELAAALADDANAYTTLDNKINTKVSKAGDTMTGNLSMGANVVTSTAVPSANSDLTNKAYVDTQRDTRLATAGGTMSGGIDMGGNTISNAAAPVAGTDLTNKTYVDGILGSATVAATAAANALTSETNAANSQANAAASAASAAADLSSVQNIYDQFDDRYLGAKAVAPTLDNDGNALAVGALFFDTSTSSMKVYSASGWVPAGSSVNGTSERFKFTCALNQNSFSGADDNGNSLTYDSGYLDVFVNGVKLVNGDDFAATTGTSIQLLFNAAAGDILEVVAYGTFTLANLQMDDLNDVTVAGITDGQVLRYNASTSQFIAGDAIVVANAVDTAAIQAQAVTTATIADDAVTQAKIAAGAIGDTEIGTVNATAIDYNNSVSGISALTVQEAIDYLNTLSGGSSGSVASYTRDKFVATAGQTTFTPTAGYTLGYLQVFLNGILLDITDYTANDGTTVVLADPADLNDEVVIIALDSFAIAEILRVTNVSASAPNNSIVVHSSGAVLVGTDTLDLANQSVDTGIALQDGYIEISGSQGQQVALNRLGGAGDNILLQHEGVSIGAIGVTNQTVTGTLQVTGNNAIHLRSDDLYMGSDTSDNLLRIQTARTGGYGFSGDPDTNNIIFTNEQGTSNQAIFFGETGVTDNAATLFGISNTGAGADPTTGSETWLPALDIKGNGCVLMPRQPKFMVSETYPTSTVSWTNDSSAYFGATSPYTFTSASVLFDTGSNFNHTNGRFTAPVGGVYFFTFQFGVQWEDGSSEAIDITITKNGSSANGIAREMESTGNVMPYVVTAMHYLELAAGDYVQFGATSSGNPTFAVTEVKIGGHLVG
jgi:hypothetical protein